MCSLIVAVVVAVAVGLLLLILFSLPKLLPPKCEGFAAPGWHRVADEFR